MNEWLTSWNAIYYEAEHKWSRMTIVEQEKRLDELEKMANVLIDKWTDLDELLHELRMKKTQLELLIRYESPGTTYYELEMFERAAELLSIETATGDQEEIRNLYVGFAYLFSDQLNEAKEKFLYVSQTSNHVYVKHFAFVGLGCVHTRLDRTGDAIVAFEYANQLTTTDDVVYNLGISYFSNESYHLAKLHFTNYLEHVPDDGEALFFLGCCQWIENDEESAWASWLASVHILNSTTALLALAYVCEWHGHHKMAIHCYKQLQKKDYDQIQTLHGLAWNYALVEDNTKAFAIFREILSVDPTNTMIQQSLFWLQKNQPKENWKQLVTVL